MLFFEFLVHPCSSVFRYFWLCFGQFWGYQPDLSALIPGHSAPDPAPGRGPVQGHGLADLVVGAQEHPVTGPLRRHQGTSGLGRVGLGEAVQG